MNAKEQNIINSFVNLIKDFDKRISTIINVTKIFFLNVDSNLFQSIDKNICIHDDLIKLLKKYYIKIFEQKLNQKFRR